MRPIFTFVKTVFNKIQQHKTMTKYFLTSLLLLLFTQLATAQLRLEKVGSHATKSIPIGTTIDLQFPTKTSKPDCECFQRYGGILRSVSKEGVELEMTYQQRVWVDDSKVGFNESKQIKQPADPLKTQMSLTKIQSITVHKPDAANIQNAAALFIALAIINNLFIAPHVENPLGKTLRNAGYITMAAGIAVAFIPTKKTYHFEQPKDGGKTLWKLKN